MFPVEISVCAGPPCGADRGPSSLCSHGEGPPPPPPSGSGASPHLTLLYPRNVAVTYCGVTSIQERWKHLEGSIASSLVEEVSFPDTFSRLSPS
jgi:hypothetical protein